MAGKKPAKPIAGQNRTVVQDPAIYGSIIKFVGMKSSPCVCSQCGRETIRGIVRIKTDIFFCSATCAKNHWTQSQRALAE